MIWQSFHEFFAMGGYGLYVWGSLSIVFLLLFGEIISLRVRSKSIQEKLHRIRTLEQP